MKNVKWVLHLIVFPAIILLSFYTADSNHLMVKTQTTGMLNTNCYLVYDNKTNEAALIDPGDYTDSLVTHIEENNLILKYIFFTHCHPDHMYGVLCMNLNEKYPNAKICFTKEGYNDMFETVANWKEVYPEYIVNMIESSTEALKIFNMDYEKIGEPDLYIEDNQIFTLGEFKIRAIKTPGHARGSVSLYAQSIVFTGDELQFGKVGGTNISPISSFENQVQSIRKLYTTLPDETIVYPGHGKSTTIGFEKINNRNITLEKAIQ